MKRDDIRILCILYLLMSSIRNNIVYFKVQVLCFFLLRRYSPTIIIKLYYIILFISLLLCKRREIIF